MSAETVALYLFLMLCVKENKTKTKKSPTSATIPDLMQHVASLSRVRGMRPKNRAKGKKMGRSGEGERGKS